MEDGTDAFQIYKNGGTTACYTYFMADALQKLKMNDDAKKVLHPILKSMSKGKFDGRSDNGMLGL